MKTFNYKQSIICRLQHLLLTVLVSFTTTSAFADGVRISAAKHLVESVLSDVQKNIDSEKKVEEILETRLYMPNVLDTLPLGIQKQMSQNQKDNFTQRYLALLAEEIYYVLQNAKIKNYRVLAGKALGDKGAIIPANLDTSIGVYPTMWTIIALDDGISKVSHLEITTPLKKVNIFENHKKEYLEYFNEQGFTQKSIKSFLSSIGVL